MGKMLPVKEALEKYPKYSCRVWIAGCYITFDRDDIRDGINEEHRVEIDHGCCEIDFGSIFVSKG